MSCAHYFGPMFSQTSLFTVSLFTSHNFFGTAGKKDQKPPDKQKHAGAELEDAALNGDRKKGGERASRCGGKEPWASGRGEINN